MHGDSNRARLIRNRAGDRLANPPRCVCGEFIALAIVKLFNRLDQAEVSLLNQVEKQHAAANISLCDGNDETQVRFGELMLRLGVSVRHALRDLNLLIRGEQRHFADLFEIHAHRVVDVDALDGGQRALDLRDLLVDVLRHFDVFNDVDIQLFEVVVDLFDLLLIELQLLQGIHDLLIGKHALLFAGLNQLV